jgi:hypothetical protein
MEGPPFAIVLLTLSFAMIWVYQTFFQKVAANDRDFESFCTTRPTLAAFAVAPGKEELLARTLTHALGKRREVVVTLGPWPWTSYALAVETLPAPGVVRLGITRARMLRTRETHPPALLAVLTPCADAASSSWLHPACYVNGLETVPNAGWRLAPGGSRGRGLEPWLVQPDWLDPRLVAPVPC